MPYPSTGRSRRERSWKRRTWKAIQTIAIQVLVTLMTTEIAAFIRDVATWPFN